MRIQSNLLPVNKQNFESINCTHNEGLITGKKDDKLIPYEVFISEEGRNKCNEMFGTSNSPKSEEYRNKLSNSIIDINGVIQSNFHKDFKELNTKTRNASGNDCTSKELIGNCTLLYSQYYDEIQQRYANGSNELWTVDSSSDDGFRKITVGDEIAALDSSFDYFAAIIDSYDKYGRGFSDKFESYRNSLYTSIDRQREQNLIAEKEYQENLTKFETFKNGTPYQELKAFQNAWKMQYNLNANVSKLYQSIMHW